MSAPEGPYEDDDYDIDYTFAAEVKVDLQEETSVAVVSTDVTKSEDKEMEEVAKLVTPAEGTDVPESFESQKEKVTLVQASESGAVTQSRSFLEDSMNHEWSKSKSKLDPSLNWPVEKRGKSSCYARLVMLQNNEHIYTQEEVAQLPPGFFMSIPYSFPTVRDIMRHCSISAISTFVGLVCWGCATRMGLEIWGKVLRLFGWPLLTASNVWASGTDLQLSMGIYGGQCRCLGIYFLSAIGLGSFSSLIPHPSRGTFGFLFEFGFFTVLAQCSIPWYTNSMRPWMNWQKWLPPTAQVIACVNMIPFFFGYMLFHVYWLVPNLGEATAASIVGPIMGLIEKKGNGDAFMAVKKLQWPIVQKAQLTLEEADKSEDLADLKKQIPMGGDWNAAFTNSLCFMNGAGECFRFSILLSQAVENPNDYVSLIFSFFISYVLNVATRSEWLARAVVFVMELTLPKRFYTKLAPNSMTRLTQEAKKVMGYPRYFGFIGVVLARLALTQNVEKAIFSERGYAPLFVFLASVCMEIIEDLSVHIIKAYDLCPKWRLFAHIYEDLPPLHWQRVDGPQFQYTRMQCGLSTACLGTSASGWFVTSLVLTVGLPYLVGCKDIPGFKEGNMFLRWPSESCHDWTYEE